MGKLNGKTILFSGVFEGFERTELEKLAIAAGAKLLSGVSKNLDYLVAGEKMGPQKRQKADELGVPVITLASFLNLLEDKDIALEYKEVAESKVPAHSASAAHTKLETVSLNENGEASLYKTKEKTGNIWYPKRADVFADPNPTKGKLLPVLSFNAGQLHPELGNLRLHFLAHDVSMDNISFELRGDKYHLLTPTNKIPKFEDLSEYNDDLSHVSFSPQIEEERDDEEMRYYDETGKLQRTDYRRRQWGTYKPWNFDDKTASLYYKLYQYKTINGKNELASAEKYINIYPPVVVEKIHYEYDSEGRISTEIIEIPGPDQVYSYNLIYTEQKNGVMVITASVDKDYAVILVENENESEAKKAFWTALKKFPLMNDNMAFMWIDPNNRKPIEEVNEWVSRRFFSNFYSKYQYIAKWSYEETNDRRIVIKDITFNTDGQGRITNVSFTNKGNHPIKNKPLTYNKAEDGTDEVTYGSNEKPNYIIKRDGDTVTVKDSFWKKPFVYKNISLNEIILRHRRIGQGFFLDGPQTETEKMELVSESKQAGKPTETEWLKHEYSLYPNSHVRVNHVTELKRKANDALVTLHVGAPLWMQHDETPTDPDGNPMKFIVQLREGALFGDYYLFYSAKHNLVTQVFQCT